MPPTVLTRFVGDTTPIHDTLTYEAVDPQTGDATVQPIDLSDALAIQFTRQDATTGNVVIDHAAAQVLQNGSGDNATQKGQVAYSPGDPEVATARETVIWWTIIWPGPVRQDTPDSVEVVRPHGVSAAGPYTPTTICQAWATNEDVIRYNVNAIDDDFTSYLIEASELLNTLIARQYPGTCTRTVRPHRATCGCWQVLSRGHIIGPYADWIGGTWQLENEFYTTFGCGMQTAVRLAGRVQAVTQVRISGAIVDSATYRVDLNEWLVRLTDPATGQNPGWPTCQNLSLPPGSAGTFEVDYTWGRTPPIAGVRAAATLAWQLYLLDNPQGQVRCALPAGWTSISRQGVTVSRQPSQKFPTESGIPAIDAFIQTTNPAGLDRVPAVYSRDVAPYARRIG